MTEPGRTTRLSLRRSLVDPVVIAAAVALGGSVVTAFLTIDRSFEADQKRCDRAFAFLQDETISPRLEINDGFYRSQLAIAQGCSLAKD